MTGHEKLTREIFIEMTDTHGADLSRWPLHFVKPALALMAEDAGLQALFDRARSLDDVLRRADADMDARIAARHGSHAPDLQARILAAVSGAPAQAAPVSVVLAAQPAAAPGGLRGLFAPGGGFLMLLGVLGFLVGFQPAASAEDMLLTAQDMIIAGDSAMLAAGGL